MPEQIPYDRVIVTAAGMEIRRGSPLAWLLGGVLVAPVGSDRRDQQLLRIRRTDRGFATEDFGLVRFVPLVTGLPRQAVVEA